MKEKCKCYTCLNYGNGECACHKDIKAFVKPNTELFNYNVKLRNCYISK